MRGRIVAVAILVSLPGCAAWAQAPGRPAARPFLPAIAPRQGPLLVHVVYPDPNQRITASDSTFFFGSTGDGRARLTVNGEPVDVAPNGAFLAYVALPADTAPVMRFVARLEGDSAVLDLPIRTPNRFVPPDTLWIRPDRILPAGLRWAEPGERIRVSVVAAPGAAVRLLLPSGRIASLVADTFSSREYGPFDLALARRPSVETRYVGTFVAESIGGELPSVGSGPVGSFRPDSARGAWIEAFDARGALRVPLPLRLAVLDSGARSVVVLDDDVRGAGNTDGAASGSPAPDGTYHWLLRNGTRAEVTGRIGNSVRLRLSQAAIAWTDVSNVGAVLPAGTPAPGATLGRVRLFPGDAAVTARLGLGERVPFRVDEDGARLTVTLYSTASDVDFLQYGPTDPLVQRVWWAQPRADECTITFELAAPVFGYRSRWDGTDLVLEIRRPPSINRGRPLRGRTVAVDPGHPPGGATGPTGLREADANLEVARALRAMLERAGARVVMTRKADTSLGLYERTNLAEAQHADILVSIHNNAFPDGVNPWTNNGTSTYFYHPRATRLALLIQQAMVRRMGLRDLGIGRADLALARPTWMPAVLTEGAFLMIPEQENALRAPAFQERYARGVMEGIEAFLRERAGSR